MKNISKRIFSILCALFVLLSTVVIAVPGVYATEAGEEAENERFSYVFRAEDITLPYSKAGMCDGVVEDPDSQYGKAVKLSYEERLATGDAGLYNVMIYPAGSILSLYTCDNKEGKPAGWITSEQLVENGNAGKYVTYKFSGVDMTGKSFMYIFNCWGLQIRFSEEQINAMQGKVLVVSVSLKVTGDVTNPATNPSYYFDEIIVAEADPNEVHIHSFGEWQSAGEYNHESKCTVDGCTEAQTGEHEWGEAEVTKEPTAEAEGEMTYTCKVCKGTRTKKFGAPNAGVSSNNNTNNNDQKQNQEIDPVLWIAIGLFAVAAIVIVLAVVFMKRGNKSEE